MIHFISKHTSLTVLLERKVSLKEMNKRSQNLDQATVNGFGDEWSKFDQSDLSDYDKTTLYNRYFSIFPFKRLAPGSRGFDMGAGSGRWAQVVADRVGHLHLIDASDKALGVAQRNLSAKSNCSFHHASVEAMPIADSSMDFGYSLGVLHHLPNTQDALNSCVRKLKPGAPFLLYLYYRFDNRPFWFRWIWRTSDVFRRMIAWLPFGLRARACDLIAVAVYWPLARLAFGLEKLGMMPSHFPLSSYRHLSLYSMRTDALDRFGTRLEQRFTRVEIDNMMRSAGLTAIQFSEEEPFWCAIGYKQNGESYL